MKGNEKMKTERLPDSEERMAPLVEHAENNVKSFIASIARIAIQANNKYETQDAADKAAFECYDEAFGNFCKAFCSSFRMMLAQMVEDKVLNQDIFCLLAESEGDAR